MFFGGAPLWHASVAIWSLLSRQPKLLSSWTDDDRAKAERHAMTTLAGVGVDDRTVAEPGAAAMHFRRQTTERERDYVFKTHPGRIASMKHERDRP